jgi:hypothetical protein
VSNQYKKLLARAEKALARLDEELSDVDDVLGLDRKLDALATQLEALADAHNLAEAPPGNPRDPYLVIVLRRLSQHAEELTPCCDQADTLYDYAHEEEYGSCLISDDDLADASECCLGLHAALQNFLESLDE